ncbi:MAG: iron-sulfur cluster assembly scaffold protein, partial [Candidatus Aminicenantes bacterium]|nr:iron-sulfur cluster assembly scaffold protein [Candidatus Aminicenantes bacterium]
MSQIRGDVQRRHSRAVGRAGIGAFGDPDCVDHLKVYIKIENDLVKDIKFQIKGCPAAVACASAMTELVMGKPVEEAMEITDDE